MLKIASPRVVCISAPWHTSAATDIILFSLYIAIQNIDDEMITSNSLNPWNILSPIDCWTWWWPPSRTKHVVQLTALLQITTCCVSTSLHWTFMLHTQRGCLNSRSPHMIFH